MNKVGGVISGMIAGAEEERRENERKAEIERERVRRYYE